MDSRLSDHKLDLDTMLRQVEQVVARGNATDPPAFTLILGAGASFGVVPTARQMLGVPDKGVYHPACIPAFLHMQQTGAPPDEAELGSCVQSFWDQIVTCNGDCKLKLTGSLPDKDTVPETYKFLFDQNRVGGLNTPGDARDYLRYVTMGQDGRVRFNGTHFFLGSLLSLQKRKPSDAGAGGRPLYVGRRPFARTIFTTNFDPLLQVSLQLFQNLYYMTDRPELLASDGLHTDDHPALHLFYAHGSVHRPFLANTDNEIAQLRDANHSALAPYFATHGVIVLGYSGWDDCLLRALEQTASFRYNLYWLARGETAISPAVEKFLISHANAKWVPITDSGEFMAALHRQLCPGMAMTELLANPISPLRERLGRVDLTGIATPVESPVSQVGSVDKPITPEELRQQVVGLLEKMEQQFTAPNASDDPQLELQKLEHQADLVYANDDYPAALPLYGQIAGHSYAPVGTRAKALFRRGYCYGQEGRKADEIADYTRCIDLPGAPPELVAKALINRGFRQGQEGRNVDEIADYTRCIDLPGAPSEQVANALVNRGFRQGQEGRKAEAIADCTRCIDLPGALPDQVANALVNRGFRHGQEGRKAEAIADYTRCIDLPGALPDQVANALINRGAAHGQEGRNTDAIADYTRCIDLPGASSEQVAKALYNRGAAHGQEGRNAEAIADYTRCIDLPGTPPEIVESARQLKLSLMSTPKPEPANRPVRKKTRTSDP